MDRVDMKYLEGHAGRFYDDPQLKYAHNKYKICAFYIANVAPGPESDIVVVVAVPAQTQTSIRFGYEEYSTRTPFQFRFAFGSNGFPSSSSIVKRTLSSSSSSSSFLFYATAFLLNGPNVQSIKEHVLCVIVFSCRMYVCVLRPCPCLYSCFITIVECWLTGSFVFVKPFLFRVWPTRRCLNTTKTYTHRHQTGFQYLLR